MPVALVGAGLPDLQVRLISAKPYADRQAVRESAGYPYFIQEYGLELWNHAEVSPITVADLETVREIVRDALARSFFGPRFQLATDAEQRYLAVLAALAEPPYRTSEVATATALATNEACRCTAIR